MTLQCDFSTEKNFVTIYMYGYLVTGSAIAQAVTTFPLWWPEFEPGSSHVEFVVDKAVLGQVFSEYFGFPSQAFIPPTASQSSLFIIYCWYNKPISGSINRINLK
jgi:hypothetical protein